MSLERVRIELTVDPPGAEIAIIGPDPEHVGLGMARTVPQPVGAGRFVADLLVGRDYHVFATAPGRSSAMVLLTPLIGGGQVLHIELPPAPAVPLAPPPAPPEPAVRIGLDPFCFQGDGVPPGQQPLVRAMLEAAVDSYFMANVKGIELVSQDALEVFRRSLEAIKAQVLDRSVLVADRRFEGFLKGPDVLVKAFCFSVEPTVHVSAKVTRATSGLRVGHKFVSVGLSREERDLLRVADNVDRLGEEMAGDDVADVPAGQLQQAGRRLARQVAHRLHTLYPRVVFPSDLPLEYDTCMLHIGELEQGGYPVFAESEPGDRLERLGHLDPAPLASLRHQARVIARRSLAVEDPPGGIQEADDAFMATFGQALYGWLGPEVQARIVESWQAARAQQPVRGLRLRLCCEPGLLSALPWEYLWVPWLAGEPADVPLSGHVGLRTDFVLSRYAMQTLPEALPEFFDPKISALVVIPKANDLSGFEGLEVLDTDRESGAIDDALQFVREQRSEEDLRAIVPEHLKDGDATWNRVSDHLRVRQWQVFHFVGHGWVAEEGQAVQLLGAAEEGVETVVSEKDVEGLREILLNEPALRLVMLQSCESGAFADESMSSIGESMVAFVPAVVAMQHTIGVDKACSFARAFYMGLALGHDVDVAVAEGRHAISVQVTNERDWGTPVVYMQQASLFGRTPIELSD